MAWKTCPGCNGAKRLLVKNMKTKRYELKDCKTCKGQGRLWK